MGGAVDGAVAVVLSGWRKWANKYSMDGLGFLVGWCFGSLGVWVLQWARLVDW
jgi:hypothetical protein